MDLPTKLKDLRNMRVTVISVAVSALGTVSKETGGISLKNSLRKNNNNGSYISDNDIYIYIYIHSIRK